MLTNPPLSPPQRGPAKVTSVGRGLCVRGECNSLLEGPVSPSSCLLWISPPRPLLHPHSELRDPKLHFFLLINLRPVLKLLLGVGTSRPSVPRSPQPQPSDVMEGQLHSVTQGCLWCPSVLLGPITPVNSRCLAIYARNLKVSWEDVGTPGSLPEGGSV